MDEIKVYLLYSSVKTTIQTVETSESTYLWSCTRTIEKKMFFRVLSSLRIFLEFVIVFKNSSEVDMTQKPISMLDQSTFHDGGKSI